MQVPALSDGQAGPANQPTAPIPAAQQNQADQQVPSAQPGQGNASTVALYQQPAPALPQGALPSGETAAAQQQTIVATRGPEPVISVRDLRKTYILGKKTQIPALRGVSLEIYPGEFVAIMGPSGSGKSTFMNQLGCLDRPSAGEYWLAGRLVSNLSSDELARVRNRLIGFVFQGFNLLGRATALSNVALPAVYAGVPRRERERRARKLLQLVGLGGRLHHKPPELSGGQQQRVAIARALVNGPALLLADEPTGNLDSRTSVEIMGVLQALNEQGLTIVLVTHDPKIAAYAKRQVSFLDGRIVRDEPTPSPRSAQAEWSALLAEEAKNAAGAAETTAQEGAP
ncbi:MAG: ABC transporter ATP-binding protein [Ktedonobacteraceae bacterium]|nr:ABC transporter ATP-binding protein [Ktedonobacteraceae bacterium]